MIHLPDPHGGTLINAATPDDEIEKVTAETVDDPSLELSDFQICDLEQLIHGGFSPLRGFMSRTDYESVLLNMRLTDGKLWPIPITLSVSTTQAESLREGSHVALRNQEGLLLARMKILEMWRPWLKDESEALFGTMDEAHPGVRRLFSMSDAIYLAGEVKGVTPIPHYDFKVLRRTPTELRTEFERMGWRHVVAFQTRNPLHRAHVEMTLKAATSVGANLLLHPVVGITKPGDIDHYTRIRCYQATAQYYPPGLMMLSLLNLSMRMAGPREALWHAIIRKNYGCSHFIVGRDHAGPGSDQKGNSYYGPYEAQELLERHQAEIDIKMVPFKELVFVPSRHQYVPINELPEGEPILSISGTEMRRRLREGVEIPEWFSYPNVIEELRRSYPPKHKQGITVFFTGLSGAGKSTIANVLLARFLEIGGRPVTLLDGDIVRKNLSSELGFSREHRDLNILRIGYVANEITKNGGIAICAPIAPYAETRARVRELISAHGAFIEIYVSTSLEVCEQRDRKGLYAKARNGQIPHFTGISDPYEAPVSPELTIDTADNTPDEATQIVWLYLEREGYVI